MKAKLLFFCLILFAAGTQMAFSQWIHRNAGEGIIVKYGVQLNVANRDTAMVISLKIKDDVLRKTIDYGSISLTPSNVKDTVALNAMLKDKYRTLFRANGRTPVLRHSDFVETMALSIHDTTDAKFQRSYVYQGLLMFSSLLKGARRDVANTGSVNYRVMETFPVVVSGFVCEQDVVINAAEFKAYLRERQPDDPTNGGIQHYLNALEYLNGNMTMSQIRVQLNNYFMTSRWPQGGQCGCCGNYSGNCYYWNAGCLAHDMACQRCQHSWCFSGCKPTSCSGNSIAWYWYAVKVITPYP